MDVVWCHTCVKSVFHGKDDDVQKKKKSRIISSVVRGKQVQPV